MRGFRKNIHKGMDHMYFPLYTASMDLHKEDIEAYIAGEELPSGVVEQIEKEMDTPHSLVRTIGREYAFLSRKFMDPESPLPFTRSEEQLLKEFQDYPNN